MAKDPAFLFYSKDFYEGTRMMLPEERACFIDLMIYQHQNGFIPDDKRRLMMYCSGIDEATLEATLEAKEQLSSSITSSITSLDNISEPDKSDSVLKEKSLQTILKEKFEDYYKKNKTESYYYQAKDAAQLKQIITKVKFSIKEKKGKKHKVENLEIIEAWDYILSKIKGSDSWVYDNLSIPTINTKFNELVSKIRSNGQSTKNQQNSGKGGKRTQEHQEPKKSFTTPND